MTHISTDNVTFRTQLTTFNVTTNSKVHFSTMLNNRQNVLYASSDRFLVMEHEFVTKHVGVSARVRDKFSACCIVSYCFRYYLTKYRRIDTFIKFASSALAET